MNVILVSLDKKHDSFTAVSGATLLKTRLTSEHKYLPVIPHLVVVVKKGLDLPIGALWFLYRNSVQILGKAARCW